MQKLVYRDGEKTEILANFAYFEDSFADEAGSCLAVVAALLKGAED